MRAMVGDLKVHYEQAGSGEPVVLLHGSGPGVSAAANWAGTMPELVRLGYQVIAPDVVGFGNSDKPEQFSYGAEAWAANLGGLLDALGLDSAHVVGNSMGGRIALTLAARAPARVRSLTVMGVRGTSDAPALGNLHKVRAYSPSVENMRRLLTMFVTDPSVVTEEMVQARYAASVAPGAQASYQRIFASGAANLLPLDEDDLRGLAMPTLILHGREDQVIPVECAYQLTSLIPDVRTVVVSRCGHWVQVEQAEFFIAQLGMFLGGSGRLLRLG